MKRCAATPCNEVKLRNNLFLEPCGFTRCRMSFARPRLQKKKQQQKTQHLKNTSWRIAPTSSLPGKVTSLGMFCSDQLWKYHVGMEHLGYSRLPVTEIINPVTYLPPFIKPLIIVWQYDVIFKKLHQLMPSVLVDAAGAIVEQSEISGTLLTPCTSSYPLEHPFFQQRQNL